MRARAGLLALLLLAPTLAGCLGPPSPDDEASGVVVTGQPIMDAFDRMDEREHVVGIPDWAAVDQPWNATRLGRPFTIEPEAVIRLDPRILLDQPHPLVSGPSRKTLATGLEQAGIAYRKLPVEPRFSTVRTTLEAVENLTGTPAEPVWRNLTANLAELNRSLEGSDRPKALVLFPAGLTAGTGTDADRLLELANLRNVAAEAGLSGYRQITTEAVRRIGVDVVLATSTMHDPPAEIAAMPMFEGTAVEGNASRVLVVDPSRTMRMGPYLDQAAHRLATWAHPSLPGPSIHASVAPLEAPACGQLTVRTDAPNATVRFLGEEHPPGNLTVPEVRPGHYRLTITARDGTGTASLAQLVTVEGSDCETA